MNNKKQIFITIGIILIAFNLRAPITSVGAIVNLIQEQFSLSAAAAGLITTLPLVAFAIISPFVARISQHIGYGKAMTIGLLLILLGEIVRSYTNSYGLYWGTILLGIGIAIGNVLIPSIIKQEFPNQTGKLTSIYVTSMCIFAAVGAGSSVPLANTLELGWQHALALWSVLAILTLVVWLPQLRNKATQSQSSVTKPETPTASIWKSTTAWWVTLFMGIQSLLFYSLVAWLPTIIISKGLSDSFAATMALTYQLVAIPATLIIPTLCDKYTDQRRITFIVCLLYLIGLLIFSYSTTAATLTLAIILMSLAMGGSISLSIAFISLRSSNAKRASELSGMSQSAGYLLAAIGPLFTGMIFDYQNSWSLPITLFCVLVLGLIICGFYAGSAVYTDSSDTDTPPVESMLTLFSSGIKDIILRIIYSIKAK